MAKLLYQGHGSLRLTSNSGKVIYIDPFIGEGYEKPADFILVTHQHHDHNCIDLPAKAKGCKIIQNMDALQNGVYQKFSFGDITIEATEAYNDKHPKAECVGYLVFMDNILLYFAGDTAQTEQMKDLQSRAVDYALLPIDGIYTMDVQGAVKCAQLIKAKHTIPIHMAPGKLFDGKKARQFAEGAEGALILEAGEEIELAPCKGWETVSV